MSKGSRRRPEDYEAICRHWPFPEKPCTHPRSTSKKTEDGRTDIICVDCKMLLATVPF